MFVETDRPPAYADGCVGGAAFTREELARAEYGADGIFTGGRRSELDLLRAMGYRDASLGRLYEGHFNGVLLVARYGTPDQRERAHRDARAGHLFGVWNTEDDDPMTLRVTPAGFVLSGTKTWASGADTVTRALITARADDGSKRMCVVRLDDRPGSVDRSTWAPLGMHESNSFNITFAATPLAPDDVVGAAGDYESAPWFLGGALRFAAVHAGIIERLTADTLAYLVERRRTDDPLQQARAGEMRIASQAAANWIDAGLQAWEAFDRDGSPRAAQRVVHVVDMARLAIERAGLDVLERAERAAGAHGLLESAGLAHTIRDLRMYLRQPAPDATLRRVGSVALGRTEES